MDVHPTTICRIAVFLIRIAVELQELSLNRLVPLTAHIPLLSRDRTVPLSSQPFLIMLLRVKTSYPCRGGKPLRWILLPDFIPELSYTSTNGCVTTVVFFLLQVLSKDAKISGDEGWWTGKIRGKVGIFPANFVAESESIDRVSSVIDKVQPIEIDFEELQLEEVIGVGGFGKVYRYMRAN